MDEWDEPPHPREEDRFAVRYEEYPGGQNAYWSDFRTAACRFYTACLDDMDDHHSAESYAEEQVHYALKRRVHDTAQSVAKKSNISYRNLCHWLVKEKGFPWRNDADLTQLQALLEYLEDPCIINEAQQAPDYPNVFDPERVRRSIAYWQERNANRGNSG